MQVIHVTRGKNGATWIHPYLALDFATYLHPDITVKVHGFVHHLIEHDIKFIQKVSSNLKDVKTHDQRNVEIEKKINDMFP